MADPAYHVPVLVDEVVHYLDPTRGGLFFDGTVGGGGHSEAILRAGAAARVFGVDQDPEALEVAAERLDRYGDRVTLRPASFADAASEVSEPLAGALLDLGVSSHQIDAGERGFSFRPGLPLDMRMDPTRGRTAAELLNEAAESELADIFYEYGEEPGARRLAAEVVREREERPFRTSDDLVEAMHRAIRGRITPKDKARIFQALRIAVNDELEALDRGLPALREALAPAGVLVVLSYHSLEDRRVKNAFRDWSRACVCPPELPVCRCRGEPLGSVLTRRPVTASEAEVASNPRARSVRLRAWEKAS